MTPLRLLCVLTAAALAGAPAVSAQTNAPNPFATPAPHHRHGSDGRGSRHHRRMEFRGERMERRGERMEHRGERREFHGDRLRHRDGVRLRNEWHRRGDWWQYRGGHMERRGARLQRDGIRSQHRDRGFGSRSTSAGSAITGGITMDGSRARAVSPRPGPTR